MLCQYFLTFCSLTTTSVVHTCWKNYVLKTFHPHWLTIKLCDSIGFRKEAVTFFLVMLLTRKIVSLFRQKYGNIWKFFVYSSTTALYSEWFFFSNQYPQYYLRYVLDFLCKGIKYMGEAVGFLQCLKAVWMGFEQAGLVECPGGLDWADL